MSAPAPVTLYCPACQSHYALADGHFSCPRHGGPGEHILDPVYAASKETAAQLLANFQSSSDSLSVCMPLLASAQLFGPPLFTQFASHLGERLARFEGKGIHVSPLRALPQLAQAIGHAGSLAVKDETGQVGGSHKIRHLAGTLVYLEALRHLARAPKRRLAISSCGNAALSAATIARAAGYTLRAYVPEDIDNTVEALLLERRCVVEVVPRLTVGQGDPPYLAFKEAVAAGAAPFSCSGRDNWSHVDFGQSLGVEAALQWRASTALAAEQPDHVVVQVGGGALARCIGKGFRRVRELGLIKCLPRLHVCQTAGLFVLVRTWLAVLGHVLKALGHELPVAYSSALPPRQALARLAADYEAHFPAIKALAELVAERFDEPAVQAALAETAANGAALARPWDGAPPHSLAHGILDDETYDWYFLVREMLATGGLAAILTEDDLTHAQTLARTHTGAKVSATGAAGLAGLVRLSRLQAIDRLQSVCLFFTGVVH